MNNFSLMILAAGYGRRMMHLTREVPKPLLKINDRELFLSKEVMVEQNLLEKTPPIKLFPYYILDKQQRKITDKTPMQPPLYFASP